MAIHVHCRHIVGVDVSEIGTNMEVSVVQNTGKISKAENRYLPSPVASIYIYINH